MNARILAAWFGVALACLAYVPATCAQGPGSCGFHLDILANETSTHSAVADAVYPPGGGFFPYPAGVPGNPYQAYATPGTTLTVRVTIPPSTLGPAPIGPGSTITILYSVGSPFIPIPPVPGIIPPCQPGEALVICVVPIGGAIVDGVGFFAAVPPVPPADPGHPYELDVAVLYPAIGIAAPVILQAVAITPAGMIAISNGVSLLPGPNPAEISLIPGLIPTGFVPATDDGFAPVPTPPGFTFYGFPQPAAQVSTNPFIEFIPFGLPPSDLVGTPGDLGCAPATINASPRIAVNHYDADFGIPAPAPRVTDITLEFAPPMPPGLPSRFIYRWKNGPEFGSPPPFPDTDYATQVVELWGDDSFVPPVPCATCPAAGGFIDAHSRVVVVRQEIHSLTSAGLHAQLGFGPGLGAAPCTPLPFWTLYGFAPYFTLPFEAVHMDPATMGAFYPVDSTTMTNLALVLDPPALPPLPGSYIVQVY